MNQIDAKLFALITAATVFVVGALKKCFPKLVDGKEEIWAVALPLIFVAIAKATSQFRETGWIDALLWAFGSGVVSGAAHDYAVKPGIAAAKGLLLSIASMLFKKEPRMSGEPPPPAPPGGEPKP
jgi:hypothetical protein